MWAVTVISIDRKLLCQLAYKYPTDGLLASRSRARDARNRNRSNSHNVTTPPSVAPCNPRPAGCIYQTTVGGSAGRRHGGIYFCNRFYQHHQHEARCEQHAVLQRAFWLTFPYSSGSFVPSKWKSDQRSTEQALQIAIRKKGHHGTLS